MVAYRGTQNLMNILLDVYFVNISPDGAEQIKINRGFYIATMSLYDKVSYCKSYSGFECNIFCFFKVVTQVEVFRSLKPEYKSYKIVITGKGNVRENVEFKNSFFIVNFSGLSFGAAMARVTEFFVLFLNQFPGVTIEVYTFGEPRSGNKCYVDFLNNQNVTTVRVTHQ